uniref:Uncharacterized protein n=1 Tax=Meloidogyne hapla TaxID=6305 RepID=A0A1I8BKA6_MELHA
MSEHISSSLNNSSQLIQIFCNSISLIELLIHLILLPISIIFVFLIVRTSLLHWNLKFILLWQCFCNLIYGVSRYFQNILAFENAFQQAYSESVLNVTLGTLVTLYGSLFLGLMEIAVNFIYRIYSFTMTVSIRMAVSITYIMAPREGFHPILNIHLKQLLKKFRKKFLKLNLAKVGDVETSSTKAIPLNIDGSLLIIEECTDLSQKHFEILKQLWK